MTGPVFDPGEAPLSAADARWLFALAQAATERADEAEAKLAAVEARVLAALSEGES